MEDKTESRKKYKILIVDDDKFLLEMYSVKFQKSGCQITTTTSSTDAMAKMKEGFSPDVLVSDLIMPNMDGLEFLEAVKKENLAPNAVFIMLTNNSGQPEIERAKVLGVAGYIVKATMIPSQVVEEIFRITEANKK